MNYLCDDVTPRMVSKRNTSGASEVRNDENKFSIKLDVSHFSPEEITVKTIDNAIVIHGKHEEKLDQHGWISREFTRKYALPEGCEHEKVTSSLKPYGALIIEAPKKIKSKQLENERVIPITMAKKEAIHK